MHPGHNGALPAQNIPPGNKAPVVLVVDDEVRILELVRAYLEKDGFTTLCAKNGKEALHHLESAAPQVMLLDLMLPDITGEVICRRVREKSRMPIIMMTARTDEESVIRGLNMGADDYVTKPFSPRELAARVRAAVRRSGMGQALPPRLLSGGLVLDTEKRRAEKDGRLLSLTHNEYKLLLLFMSHPCRVFTRDEIIEQIKSEDFEGFDRTIDTHIKNLRQKIGDDSKPPRYIQTVYGMGYRFAGEEALPPPENAGCDQS